MDIKQDPNSIPDFNAGGRIGELQPNEPEQAQSSVELDPTAGGDGAASESQAQHEDLLSDGHTPLPGRGDTPPPGGDDPSRRGGGAIDGLVGAP